MDQAVCGVYVDLGAISDLGTKPITVKIPIKINLHQFLLLSPIHYLPSFCGRWELQLYFGSKNLVICPVDPQVYLPCTPYSKQFWRTRQRMEQNGRDSQTTLHKLIVRSTYGLVRSHQQKIQTPANRPMNGLQ
jgi:hypothetical protein